MPPKKKQKVEDQNPAVLCLAERLDFDMLRSIYELELDSSVEGLIFSLLEQQRENPSTYRMVQYRPGEFEEGRLYEIGRAHV